MNADTGEFTFEPRVLTRSELKRLDVYIYASPKLKRTVTVIRPAALAQALAFEFTPTLPVYVERPRHLKFDDASCELSFFTRSEKGQEEFHLLHSPPAGGGGPTRAAERRREAISEAARTAHIALRWVHESSFLPRAIENANRLRLLTYVQTFGDLSRRDELRGRVLELFGQMPKLSFHRLEQALPDADPRDVRATACALVHGGQLQLDWASKLHMHSVLEKGDRA